MWVIRNFRQICPVDRKRKFKLNFYGEKLATIIYPGGKRETLDSQ